MRLAEASRSPPSVATADAAISAVVDPIALTAYAVTFVAVIVLGLLLGNVADVHVTVGVGVLIVDAVLLAALVPLYRRQGLALADLGLRPTFAMRSMWWVLQALVAYLIFGGLSGSRLHRTLDQAPSWGPFPGHAPRHDSDP